MHISADEIVDWFISQHAKAGRVAECASAFKISPINALGGRVENQPKFVFTFEPRLLRLLTLGNVANHADVIITVQLDSLEINFHGKSRSVFSTMQALKDHPPRLVERFLNL